MSEFSILAASCIKTYFALILELLRAFLTLRDLVFPPFIISNLEVSIFFKIFLSLITKEIFLNPIFFICSILCSRMVLFDNFDKSLFSLDLNLVLFPAASNTK